MEIDSNNVKAYFRRGQSYLATGDAEAALKDFFEVKKLQPENKAALNQITICETEIKKDDDRQKKLYSNMFAKFAEADKKVSLNSY